MLRRVILAVGWSLLGTSLIHAQEKAVPIVLAKDLIYEGKLSAAEQKLRRILVDRPDADDARLTLGLVRVLRAWERFGQFHWKYGARVERIGWGPRIEKNPSPNRITFRDWKAGLEALHQDLAEAEAMLAGVENRDTKVLLNMADVQWDVEGDGKLEFVLPREIPGADPLADLRKVDPQIQVGFDHSDAIWLRGYCRLFLGTLDFVLAVEYETLFYLFASELYDNPLLPPQVAKMTVQERQSKLVSEVLGNLRLAEPDRWRLARGHWIKATELSDELWKAVAEEMDDDHEWLPSPKQKKGILRIEVTQDMINAWLAAMKEIRAMLEGKKLLPPWWGTAAGVDRATEGLNVQRIMDEPPKKHLLFAWIGLQSEYVEEGELYDTGVFNQLNQVFGPQLLPFAIWAN